MGKIGLGMRADGKEPGLGTVGRSGRKSPKPELLVGKLIHLFIYSINIYLMATISVGDTKRCSASLI